MRGPVSDSGPGPVGAAYRVSRPVPAVFQEDPLFLELCAAFDELIGPFVTALDCFDAYLDPWLAPADFLGWLGILAGAGPAAPAAPGGSSPGEQEHALRASIAAVAPGYRVRGTAEGLRMAAATAAGVPAGQVRVTEGGSVTWADRPGKQASPAFDATVEVIVTVPAGRDTAVIAAQVREVAGSSLPVFSQLRITVEES